MHILCDDIKVLTVLFTPYLESMAGKAQAELSAHHRGLHSPPAVAAHRAPHRRAVPLCQDLHAALKGITAAI